MEWIESGGGPLVVVPQVRLGRWCGVYRKSADGMSDYDRACEIIDEIAIICVADTEILVLGDEPFRTTWLPDVSGGFLVRWIYAINEKSVIDFVGSTGLGRVFDEHDSTGNLLFTTSGACVLFDSAEPGDVIRGASMALVLASGTYAVKSAIVNPSTEIRLLIHRLRLIAPPSV